MAAQDVTTDPDSVRLEVDDIRRLAQVLRSIESEEVSDTAAALEAGYLANASPGLRAYAVTAMTITSTLAAPPSLYADLNGLADAILAQEDALRAAFQRLLDLYPDARVPPIWFVVGDNGPGGLTRPALRRL